MGFLKKFFQTPSPTSLEVLPKSQPKQPESTSPCIAVEALSTEKQYQVLDNLRQDERIQQIENDAMAMGWTWNQLWQYSQRPDLRGLAAIIQKEQIITIVTRQYIQLERTSPTGKLEIQRFYNHNVDQPWLRKGLS